MAAQDPEREAIIEHGGYQLSVSTDGDDDQSVQLCIANGDVVAVKVAELAAAFNYVRGSS